MADGDFVFVLAGDHCYCFAQQQTVHCPDYWLICSGASDSDWGLKPWKLMLPKDDILVQVHEACTLCLLLFYGIATVPQSYHGSEMIYEMRRRKREHTMTVTDSRDL